MSSPDEIRRAFECGYAGGMYKIMNILHTAFRQQWDKDRIEAAVRRAVTQQEVEREAKAFIEAQGAN